jgi:Zn finger protein HypA/HybF involved in hydrogenase expression
MPIAPKPFKFVCPKCSYSKTVKPKSDILNPMDFISTCPKCNSKMERKELNIIDDIADLLKGKF